jgi:hypothetical protein
VEISVSFSYIYTFKIAGDVEVLQGDTERHFCYVWPSQTEDLTMLRDCYGREKIKYLLGSSVFRMQNCEHNTVVLAR